MRQTFMTTTMLLIVGGMPWLAFTQPKSTGATLNIAQEQGAPPVVSEESQSAQDQNAPSAGQQETDLQIAEGDLSKVDAQRQLFWIKKSDGEEMQFLFNNETQVEGADKTVEGLASKSGSHLIVHYKAEGATNMASRIEVQAQAVPEEQSPSSTPTPTKESPRMYRV